MIDPQLGRTLLFIIKSHRNYWAHQKDFNFRDVYRYESANVIIKFRLCDAFQLFLENLEDPRLNEYLNKVSILREHTCIHMAREIIEKNENQAQNQNHINQNHQEIYYNNLPNNNYNQNFQQQGYDSINTQGNISMEHHEQGMAFENHGQNYNNTYNNQMGNQMGNFQYFHN
jgi:hypothetical protein